jgi:hypothetical protein
MNANSVRPGVNNAVQLCALQLKFCFSDTCKELQFIYVPKCHNFAFNIIICLLATTYLQERSS